MSESKRYLGCFDREGAEFFRESLENTISKNPNNYPPVYEQILKQLIAELEA